MFAKERISCGEIIESCPVIVFPKSDWQHIAETDINCYCYYWGEELEEGALTLGLGSLYNHSFRPNAKYVRHVDKQMLDYVAIGDISEGEEITVNYNGRPDDMSPLWFDAVE